MGNFKKITVLFIILIITAGVIFRCQNQINRETTDYRTDIQPLADRFGENIEIKSCFWKANVIGRDSVGPTPYWMKGFIIINNDTLEKIENEYDLAEIKINFDEDVNPAVTGFNDFKWCYNDELSKKIKGTGFIGEFYIDTNNGVLYFDLES